MSQADQLEYEFDVTLDEAPAATPRAGRTSKWDALIDAARSEADKAAKAKRRAPDGGSPWIVYPKNRESVVGVSNLGNLTKRLGGPDKKRPRGSEHFQTTGEFFEFKLTDRVPTGEKKSSSKGVLWVRRGTVKS
jgi:hypothetical protein